LIRHRAKQAATVPTLLLFSARTWDDIIFRDELLDLHREKTGFELVIALTRDSARREGDYTRRVDAAMMSEVLARFSHLSAPPNPAAPVPPQQVFICGSNPFVEAAAQGLIAAGIPASIIRTERYGG
jgi:ferredoxin-NADP reductase